MAAETQSQKARAFVRWRPMNEDEMNLGHEEMSRKCVDGKNTDTFTIKIEKTTDTLQENSDFNFGDNVPTRMRMRNRKRGDWSGTGFSGVLESESTNEETFETCLRPLIDDYVLSRGGVANCFAYGQTGSGKTHTMLGPESEPGMFFQAGEHLFQTLHEVNAQNENDGEAEQTEESSKDNELLIHLRFAELYNNRLYNLLDNRARCDLLEARDRQVHMRRTTISEVDGLERKLIRSDDIPGILCSNADEIREAILNGMELRKSGVSLVHDQSSRSHAIIEFEIVTRSVVHIREIIADLDSQVTYVKSESKPLPPPAIFGVKSTRALDTKFKKTQAAEKEEIRRLRREVSSCVGGRMILCDLAGAEIGSDVVKIAGEFVSSGQAEKQTKEERREAIEINRSLSALAGCLKGLNEGSSRKPYRESALTKLLRRYLEGDNCATVMVANVAPSTSYKKLTIQTLRYANMLVTNTGGKRKKGTKKSKKSKKKMTVLNSQDVENTPALELTN